MSCLDQEGRADVEAWLRTNGYVSRETLERLDVFVDLLSTWTRKVNLISERSRESIWSRHILDSAQLMPLAPKRSGAWYDLGSGGGLPGIICAILSAESDPDNKLTLVESDQRKSVFLRQVAMKLGLDLEVLSARVENLPEMPCEIISARALAPIPKLFELTTSLATPATIFLLPKGSRYQAEIDAARTRWSFTVDIHRSITDPSARVVICKGVERV